MTKNDWISVRDRLPDKLEPVLVVWKNTSPAPCYEGIRDKLFVDAAYYWNNKWWWFPVACEDYLAEYGYSPEGEVDERIVITHWMPLPEPPKGES